MLDRLGNIYSHMIKMSDLVVKEDFNSQAKKFIDSGIDKKIVAAYIEKFKKIRDAKPAVAKNAEIGGLKVPAGSPRFDIDKYEDFHQLEIFVDYVAGQVARISTAGKKFDKIEIDADVKPLVSANGLEIYYAKDKHACIKYKGDRPYSWCVARSDSQNMYNTYRYKSNEPSFYFVKDVAATEEEFKEPFTGEFKNPWHFFVVQATAYEDGYIVTNANNDGDNSMSWQDLINIVPKLDGLQDYFEHVPLMPNEREQYNKFSGGITDQEFVKLSYEEKEAYLDIAIPNNELTDVQFGNLPPDLKNKFIGFGIGLTDRQYEMIKSDKNLMKRYYQISLRKYQLYLDEHHSNLVLNDTEYDIILKTPEGLAAVRSGGRDEMLKMMISIRNVKKLLTIFGEELGINIIRERPTHFIAYSNFEDIDYVFSLLTPENLTNVSIHKIYYDGGLSRQYSGFNSIPKEVIYALINAMIKYKGKLTILDAATLIPNDENSSEITDYLISLYTKGLIADFDEDYLLFYKYTGDFIKTYKIFGGKPSLDILKGEALKELFENYYIKSETSPNKRQILSIISSSLKEKINGYNIAGLINKFHHSSTPKNIQELIDYCGGTEVVKSKLDDKNIAELLRLAKPENIDQITTICSKEQLDKLERYYLEPLLLRDDVSPEKMASIIGPVAIGNIDDYSIYDLIKKEYKKEKGYRGNIGKTERFIDIFIQYRGPKLSYNVDNSNLATFLIYSNDLDKIAKTFGLEKIKLMTPYDIWHVIVENQHYSPEKPAQLLALLGKETIHRMMAHSKNDRHIVAQLGNSHSSMKMLELIIPYVNDTIPAHIISWLLYHMMGDVFDKYINLIGPNNIRKIQKDDVKNILRGWSNKDQRAKSLIPIFGKEYIKDIYNEMGYQLTPELLQEEHLTFKKYFIGHI